MDGQARPWRAERLEDANSSMNDAPVARAARRLDTSEPTILVAQDRTGSHQLVSLGTIELCISEIDQLEIHAINLRAAKVGGK